MAAVSRVPLAVVSVLTTLALGACGSDGGTPNDAAAPAPTHPAHHESATPTATPTARPTSAREHHRHKVGTLGPRTRTSTADDVHLLAADRLPTIGGRAWTVGDGTDGAVGACQKTPLDTIGAMSATSRSYHADDGLTASQVVAEFPDAKSAWRAHQVLLSWRDDCESRVKHAAVGPLEPITVHTGTADSYRGSFTARSAGLGILRAGSYLTLVEITASGDRYPTTWDPARKAVRRIARTF